MSTYPDEIDEFTTKQNIPGILYDEADTTTVYAEDCNSTNSSVVAIEETLGTNPQGVFDTVVGRLENIESELDTGAVWGQITGTIDSQSDLWSDLNNKAQVGTVLSIDGGTMNGNISMNGYFTVDGLIEPVSSSDATPKSYVDGSIAPLVERLDEIDASATFLHVANQGLASFASGGYQPINYAYTLADTASGWDATNQWYVIPKTGMYMIYVSSWYATAFTAGDKKLVIAVNGSEYNGINNPSIGAFESQVLGTPAYLNEGDIVKSYLVQNSGTSQDTDDYISVTFLKIVGIW